ncbi:MAG TPA: hypothetical protein PLQ57_14420 [Saprospiraceae bacterium]|nr:hypothetical protein [Saprospiraceae bacterium]HRG22233.1 hypothetical protein [Saprospiraceae bacterium]
MFHKITLILVGMIFSLSYVKACDVCGCSVGAGSSGLTTLFKKNHLSLSYFGYGFDGALSQTLSTHDKHYSLTASLRITPANNWYVLASVPYKWNTRTSLNGNYNVNGIGDLQATLNRVLVNSKFSSTSFYMDAGAGLKLPTGNFNLDLAEGKLPVNFNTGNQAWSPVARINAFLTFKGLGILLSPSAQWSFENAEHYQFGRQLSVQTMLFYSLKISGSFSVTPYAGWHYENIARDINSEGKYEHGTGATGNYMLTGFNVKFNNYVADLSLAQPFHSQYANEEVTAGHRFSAQLTYLF